MGIDITDPAELDWLARGRKGEITAARFSERVSEEALEADADDELVEAVSRRLVEGGFVDEPDADDQRGVERTRKVARLVVAAVDDQHREGIRRAVWEDLERSESSPQEFRDSLYERVADGIVLAYVQRVEETGPEGGQVVDDDRVTR